MKFVDAVKAFFERRRGREGPPVSTTAIEIWAHTTLGNVRQHLESQNLNIATAQEALERILSAAEAVKDETVQVLARKADSSFAETKMLIDAALQECGRLEGLGSGVAQGAGPEMRAAGIQTQITQEHSAKLNEILSQYVNRLLNEDFRSFFALFTNLVKSLSLNHSNWVMTELAKGVGAAGVSVGSLDPLQGVEFEGLITCLLERMGFRAGMTKASGDGGVDPWIKPWLGAGTSYNARDTPRTRPWGLPRCGSFTAR